jgi:serine/threonine protein kinase
VTEVEERVGPYRLVRQLGQGGMGVVYLAEGPDHKEVALKVLRPHVAHDPTARARLEREATTLKKVSHPGVAGIVDYDLQADRPYLVTRFIPGRPLDEQVDERGPLTPQRWLPTAGCLAESLQAIHRAGVIHRDLKPGNVMMFNGKPVMIDFGIAQAADDLRLTQTGLVIGTPGYLAPELIEGEMVSESADWWGWAATVAFAATGRRPFGKGPFEIVLHRVRSGKADLEGLDPRLKPLLAAALAPDRRDRPTQQEIMTGLNRYAEGRDALVTQHGTGPTVVVNPPTALMTRVMPEDAGSASAEPNPVEVAQLVPSVIPPLSAFAPLRDKLREVAAQQKAERLQAKAVPAHPATYSPAPNAAAPAAMPLPYQAVPPHGLGGPPAGPGYASPPPANYPVTYQAPANYHAPANYQPTNYQPSNYQADNYRRDNYQAPTNHPVPANPQYEGKQKEKLPPHLQPSRGGLLFTVLLALAALTALLPVAGILVAAALVVLARMVDKSSTALLRRRTVRGGPGRSDSLVAVAASPVHLVSAALITLPCAIIPLIVGFIAGGMTTLILALAYGFSWAPLEAVSVGAGAFIGLLTAWIGPGGASLRRGAQASLRAAFRPSWLSALATLTLLGVTAFLAVTAYATGPDWTPLGDAFRLPDLPNRPTLDTLRDLPILRDLPYLGR